MSRRNPRAPTVSSSAVAVGSTFDTRDTSSDGSTNQRKDTAWRTAYSTARMAVEIAKESSDMFLPLKAVVGAMSVLIRNYDVGALFLQIEHLLILHLLPVPANIR